MQNVHFISCVDLKCWEYFLWIEIGHEFYMLHYDNGSVWTKRVFFD